MTQGKFLNLIKWIIISAIVPFTITSCLKDEADPKDALYQQQFKAMKALRSDWDSAGYDVWYKIIEQDTFKLKPGKKDAVILTYDCYDGTGNLIASSDSLIAKANNFYRADVIYGPVWVELQYSIPGINVAMQKVPLYSTTEIIMPSEMANNGGPLRYKVTLQRIISDFPQFEKNQRIAYMDTIGFYDDSVYFAVDTTLWYKLKGPGDYTPFDISYSKKVSFELTGNYCEKLPGLVSVEGRQFFPINNKGKDVSHYFEDNYYFPNTPAIDSMISILCLKGYREADFITTSDNAYSTYGYVHPAIGSFIIPPYMSIHYTIKIKDIQK